MVCQDFEYARTREVGGRRSGDSRCPIFQEKDDVVKESAAGRRLGIRHPIAFSGDETGGETSTPIPP